MLQVKNNMNFSKLCKPSLRQICINKRFLCPIFSHVPRTFFRISHILSLYGKIRVKENRYFGRYSYFYKQHFHKQHQAEIGKKIKQKLSNILRLTLRYLKSNHFSYPLFYYIFSGNWKKKMVGHILKNGLKNKCVCFGETNWLIIMKIKIIMKN